MDCGNTGASSSLLSPPHATGLSFNWMGSVRARSPRSFRWRQTGNDSPVSTAACNAFINRAMPLRVCFVNSLKTSWKMDQRSWFIDGCRMMSCKPKGLHGGSAWSFKKRSNSPGNPDCSNSKAVQRSSVMAPFSVRFSNSLKPNRASFATATVSGESGLRIAFKPSMTLTKQAFVRHSSPELIASGPVGLAFPCGSAFKSLSNAVASRLNSSGVTFSWFGWR
mmetsp:Transcript_94700/g.273828  ORF Transcript_94700/g.273828 Transcript_94700/m.273828 type:complete len:222 (-) Transcript_94700:976-1641(-)